MSPRAVLPRREGTRHHAPPPSLRTSLWRPCAGTERSARSDALLPLRQVLECRCVLLRETVGELDQVVGRIPFYAANAHVLAFGNHFYLSVGSQPSLLQHLWRDKQRYRTPDLL